MAKQVMFTVVNTSTSTATFRVGGQNNSLGTRNRLRSIYFQRFLYTNSFLSKPSLMNFRGVERNKKVDLQWELAFDHRLNAIEIESGSNGSIFRKIGSVSVYDIAQGCRLALERDVSGGTFNIGSGCQYTIKELAERMARVMGKEYIEPELTGKYRMGDIRHCFADISLARSVLGYEPKILLEDGLIELVEWLQGQEADDRVDQARAELAERGLTV